MKIISKVLFKKEYDSPIKYGYEEGHKVKSYIKITAYLDFKEGLWFGISVPNATYGDRNPFKALIRAIEHESIGMAKYERMKEDLYRCGLYKKLDTR